MSSIQGNGALGGGAGTSELSLNDKDVFSLLFRLQNRGSYIAYAVKKVSGKLAFFHFLFILREVNQWISIA